MGDTELDESWVKIVHLGNIFSLAAKRGRSRVRQWEEIQILILTLHTNTRAEIPIDVGPPLSKVYLQPSSSMLQTTLTAVQWYSGTQTDSNNNYTILADSSFGTDELMKTTGWRHVLKPLRLALNVVRVWERVTSRGSEACSTVVGLWS